MKEIIEEELRVAEERLESAELLLKNKKWADAISRAYYSMFHAARALLRIYAKEPKTHTGMISEFGLTFVKTGLIEKKFGVMLRKAEELRETSDYKLFAEFEESEVKDIIINAKSFLKESKTLSVKLLKGEKFKK